MEEDKISKLDESITLLDETIKEVGTIKEKSAELKKVVDDIALLKNDYQNGLIKIEEQIKEVNKVTANFKKTSEEIKKALKEIDQKIDKSVKDIDKKIVNTSAEINQKMERFEKKLSRMIISVFVIISILLIINFFV